MYMLYLFIFINLDVRAGKFSLLSPTFASRLCFRERERESSCYDHFCHCPVAHLRNVSACSELDGCPAYTRLQTVLTDCFKYSSFRPGQLAAVIPVLHGRDVIAKMATGAGKSLCFFLVPLARSRTAIGVIISPLNALMDQQVLMQILVCMYMFMYVLRQ